MKDLIVESTRLQTAAEMLSNFFQVLSDGYNPAMLDLKVIERGRYSDQMIFMFNPQYSKNDEYVKRVVETKDMVNDVTAYLKSRFQVSLDHLMSFTIAPIIFQS